MYKDLFDLRISRLSDNDKPMISDKGSNFSFKPVIIMAKMPPMNLAIEHQESALKSHTSRHNACEISNFSFYKFGEESNSKIVRHAVSIEQVPYVNMVRNADDIFKQVVE